MSDAPRIPSCFYHRCSEIFHPLDQLFGSEKLLSQRYVKWNLKVTSISLKGFQISNSHILEEISKTEMGCPVEKRDELSHPSGDGCPDSGTGVPKELPEQRGS